MPQKRYSGLLSYPQWVQRTYMVSSIAQYLDGRKAAAVGSCSALTERSSGKVPQICHLELDASDGSRRCPVSTVDHTKEREARAGEFCEVINGNWHFETSPGSPPLPSSRCDTSRAGASAFSRRFCRPGSRFARRAARAQIP